ncbi:MAG: hypothetical protein Q8M16_21075 [Pirellulaceae bacterium]|nr:hypothetical protein [Pirellulaceae bacterium]
MFWKWFLRFLQKISEWTDLPTRWLRRSDFRFSKPLNALSGRWKLSFYFNRFLFLLLSSLSQALDWPLRWFRRIRPEGREQPNQLSWFERAEGSVSRFLLALLWLVRIPLDRGEHWFGRTKKPQTADPKLAEKQLQLALQRKNAEQAHRAKLAKSWPGRMGRFVILPAFGLFTFARAYAKTRTLALVWWSVPVAITFGLLMSVYFQFSFLDYSQVAVRYELALADAIKVGDTVQADRFRFKLEQLGMRSDRGDYRTALATAERGDLVSAYETMRRIAPPTSPGFPGAHFWIIETLLDGKMNVPSEQAADLALQHIEQLKTRVGNLDDLWFLEGLANYRQGRIEPAQNALGNIRSEFPPATALQLQIFVQQSNDRSARDTAIRLNRQIQQIVDIGRELTPIELRWRATAAHVIGDEASAVAAAENWYQSNPDSREARLNRAAVIMRQVDSWLQRPTADPSETLARIKLAATTLEAEDLEIVSRRLVLIGTNSKKHESIELLFEQLLKSDDLQPQLVAQLGSLLASRSRWDESRSLLVRAVEADPTLASGQNNLAYVLNKAYPSRRFEAISYADKAIELAPDRSEFRFTRGSIYYNLRRWDQAISDLEFAINGGKNLKEIHRMLAEAYLQTGNKELADIYRNNARPN